MKTYLELKNRKVFSICAIVPFKFKPETSSILTFLSVFYPMFIQFCNTILFSKKLATFFAIASTVFLFKTSVLVKTSFSSNKFVFLPPDPKTIWDAICCSATWIFILNLYSDFSLFAKIELNFSLVESKYLVKKALERVSFRNLIRFFGPSFQGM